MGLLDQGHVVTCGMVNGRAKRAVRDELMIDGGEINQSDWRVAARSCVESV